MRHLRFPADGRPCDLTCGGETRPRGHNNDAVRLFALSAARSGDAWPRGTRPCLQCNMDNKMSHNGHLPGQRFQRSMQAAAVAAAPLLTSTQLGRLLLSSLCGTCNFGVLHRGRSPSTATAQHIAHGCRCMQTIRSHLVCAVVRAAPLRLSSCAQAPLQPAPPERKGQRTPELQLHAPPCANILSAWARTAAKWCSQFRAAAGRSCCSCSPASSSLKLICTGMAAMAGCQGPCMLGRATL